MFKDNWRPRIDGVDDADSSAVNEIAEGLIDLEEKTLKTEDKTNKIQSVDDMTGNEEEYFSANATLSLVIGESQTVSKNANDYTDVKVGEVNKRVTTNEESISGAFAYCNELNERVTTNEGVISQNVGRIIALENGLAVCGAFELVDSAEFTEDVVTVVPNLKGKQYKEIYMVFTIPTVNADGGNTDKGRIRCYANSSNTEFFTQGSTAIENYNTTWNLHLHFKFIGNYVTGDLWHRKASNLTYGAYPSSTTQNGVTQPGFAMSEDCFNKLTVKMQDANFQQKLRCFPIGTTYELWGIKK